MEMFSQVLYNKCRAWYDIVTFATFHNTCHNLRYNFCSSSTKSFFHSEPVKQTLILFLLYPEFISNALPLKNN